MSETEKLQRQVALLRVGLEWALAAGGWRLWYYAAKPPPIISTGATGSPAFINEDVLKADDPQR